MSRNGSGCTAVPRLVRYLHAGTIVVVCLVAFTPEGYLSLPLNGFSLRWFEAIGRYPEFIHAFWVSIGLGALSSTICLLFAVPASLAIARMISGARPRSRPSCCHR